MLLVALVMTSWAQEPAPFITAAFWNVENLFDTLDNPLTADDDFTPEGRYAWNTERLSEKFERLAKVINSQTPAPAILGLCEIENRAVLETLVHDHLKHPYRIIHRDSPDERGIDVALLIDSQELEVRKAHWIPVLLPGDDQTRDILEVQLRTPGQPRDDLTVFINHWPSRWGGQAATDPLRRLAARALRTRIDEIFRKNPATDILIMGDLNDHPDDPSVHDVLLARPFPGRNSPVSLPGQLINTSWELMQTEGRGTYMYRGHWDVLDQIIISPGLTDETGIHWVKGSTAAYRPSYLLQSTGEYSGWPFRTIAGGTYLGGYSDHLLVHCQLAIPLH